MLRFLAPFILFLPVYGAWSSGGISTLWLLGLAVGWGLLCLYQAASRKPRTPQYEIACRLFLTVWIPGLLFAYALYLPFWTTTYMCLAGVGIYLGYRLVAAVLVGSVIRQDLRLAKTVGFSFYWDTLPWPWNPDPQIIREGGSRETQATEPPQQRGPYMPVEPRS